MITTVDQWMAERQKIRRFKDTIEIGDYVEMSGQSRDREIGRVFKKTEDCLFIVLKDKWIGYSPRKDELQAAYSNIKFVKRQKKGTDFFIKYGGLNVR